MPPEVQSRLIADLLDPTLHGLAPGTPIEHRQTHISHVFLAGDHAIKIKKPVDFGFLDFTTLEARERACHAEVRLNRRLAPDVYLGVEPLTSTSAGRIARGGEGPVEEWAVVMRRLPEADHLAARLAAGESLQPYLGPLADCLVRFYSEAETTPAIQQHGRRATVTGNWDENLAQTADMVGDLLSPAAYSTIAAATTRFLHVHGGLLDARADAGLVADVHGDLRGEHVFVDTTDPTQPPRIRIIDCIEFNERFRCCDTVNDLAFLGMDLDRLGAPDAARELLLAYATRRPDVGAYALWDFFKCYRAYVRGKVNGFTAREAEVSAKQRHVATAAARDAFHQAGTYASRFVRPPCIVLSGPMGCGKSTVAAALATHADLAVVSTDVVRKELAGLAPTARATEADQRGLYSAAMSERTYLAVIDRAREILETGRGVVLDGTFSRRSGRVAARKMARDAGAEFLLVRCALAPDINVQRLRYRLDEPGRISDARPELFASHIERFEPVQPDEAPRVIHCDMAQPIPTVEHAVLQGVYLHGPAGPAGNRRRALADS